MTEHGDVVHQETHAWGLQDEVRLLSLFNNCLTKDQGAGRGYVISNDQCCNVIDLERLDELLGGVLVKEHKDATEDDHNCLLALVRDVDVDVDGENAFAFHGSIHVNFVFLGASLVELH